jgi:cold shock CspA family protein/ribosome-associated translation inhibitor RaiA
MQTPLQISFQNMEPSPAIESRIREKAAKLERFHDRILRCSVVVAAPHQHQRKGQLYTVRISLQVPGKDIHVGHTGPQDHAHEDVNVAIRDAFDAAIRLLEDQARTMRGDVKSHVAPLSGKVVRLFDEYGFIETAQGGDIYFHRNSVAGGAFEKLKPGDEVRLVIAEQEGEKGPQASTVTPLGKHHIVG